MSDSNFDIVIVGAGIAGASLAWQLTAASAPDGRADPAAAPVRVLLLERESQPGLHSTGRSAAMFMESYGPPQARALTRASRAFYERPPPGFTATPILAPRGALYVAWQGQEEALQAMEDELRRTGAAITRISAAQALQRVPLLRADGLIGAIDEPAAMDIDVHALHQGFLRGFKRAGGLLQCDAELLQAQFEGQHWTLTLADGSQRHCRRLVNAAGAWADTVAQRAGVALLGLQPKRRSAFTFKAPEGIDARAWPTVAAIDDSWYIKPDAGQLLGSPANADPVAAHDVQPEELDIALAIDGIERDTTLSIRRPTRTWAGLRTFAVDGELVIGVDETCEGFFWLAGQGGYGIQSAHGAAMLAASLLFDGRAANTLAEHGVDATAMRPGRLRIAP